MTGVGENGRVAWRGLLLALLVFASTVALAVLLALFVFRPLITPQASGKWTEPGERVEHIDLVRGEIDSIDRPKYWGPPPLRALQMDGIRRPKVR